MEKLYIYIGLVSLFVAAVAGGAIKNVQPSQSSSCEYDACAELPGNICGTHFGLEWHARFPNARGQHYDEALGEFFDFYSLLELDNYCSHVLYNLLCFHYFPQCSPDRPLLAGIPCRETCEETVASCLEHARTVYPSFVFPEHLNCSNFQYGSSPCGAGSATGENDDCGSECIACPDATIHLEFATAAGKSSFEATESDGEVVISLRLANVGSYDASATLQEEVTVTLCPMSGSAELGTDFVAPQESTITFPVGSRKGDIRSVAIQIVRDSLTENTEEFTEHANITSPATALFGGSLHSSSGSISVNIINSDPPTATVMPDPEIPDGECKGTCNWRTSINKATFRRNAYTYAAHVRVVGCRDSILDVVILDCQDIECGVCPPNGDYKLPYCPNCFEMCPVGEEYIVSGLHSEESIFVSNYKKGGLCAPVSVGWQRRVPQCHT